MEKYWYALYTKPRHEFKVEDNLNELEIENYLPIVTRLKQWSDRKKKVTEPILRGYIFVNADEKERLKALNIYSVIKCVSEGGSPAKIPAWQIENLQRMLKIKSDFFLHDGLIPGSKIEIVDGPFKGVVGTLLSSPSGKTLAVSLDLLNRTIMASLPRESIVKSVKI